MDEFLFDPNLQVTNVLANAKACEDLVILPFSWNILHLVCIQAKHSNDAKHAFLKEMPSYENFKVPFILDADNKTPLHYLFAHERINYNSVNIVLTYICDYLDECYKTNPYEAQQILMSFTPLFWIILLKIEVKLKERFLTLCFMKSPTPYRTQLPQFGIPNSKSSRFSKSPEVTPEILKQIWSDDAEQVDFRTNILHLDFDITSGDMNKTIKCLSVQKSEDIFKTPLVSKIIDHLWAQIQVTLFSLFMAFSLFIVLFSVYISLENRCLPIEIILLSCSGVFLVGEVFQIYDQKKEYISNVWNYLDICCLLLMKAFIITRLCNSSNQLARSWLSSVIIIVGYLRWMSYLRIFKSTSNR